MTISFEYFSSVSWRWCWRWRSLEELQVDAIGVLHDEKSISAKGSHTAGYVHDLSTGGFGFSHHAIDVTDINSDQD
jgi:hypothetical protein